MRTCKGREIYAIYYIKTQRGRIFEIHFLCDVRNGFISKKVVNGTMCAFFALESFVRGTK